MIFCGLSAKLWDMIEEQDKWEILADCPPSEQFVSNYGGPFAQRLLVDRHQVERYLSIAALDGRVLLAESKIRRSEPFPDGVNPDGSVAGRGSLRWGQKLETDKRQNPYFQVEPDEAGWAVSVNGNLIAEDLMKRGGGARQIEERFASKFGYYTRVGLRAALLKDKFTKTGDPFLMGRIIGTGIATFSILSLPLYQNWIAVLQITSVLFSLAVVNYFNRKANDITFENEKKGLIIPSGLRNMALWVNYHRRTVANRAEVFAPPLEIDRTLLAYSYLDCNKYTGNPIVRPNAD